MALSGTDAEAGNNWLEHDRHLAYHFSTPVRGPGLGLWVWVWPRSIVYTK